MPGLKDQSPSSAVKEVHILWLTAGLSCDGDSISVTAAEQPSIEDVLLGNIPGLPKVDAMRADELGRESVIIGEVVLDHPGVVVMRTRIGGSRVVDMLSGEQLPRIC